MCESASVSECVCVLQSALPVSAADGHVPLQTGFSAPVLPDARRPFQSVCLQCVVSSCSDSDSRLTVCVFIFRARHGLRLRPCPGERLHPVIHSDDAFPALHRLFCVRSPQEFLVGGRQLARHSSARPAGGGVLRQHYGALPERSRDVGAGRRSHALGQR